MSETVMPAWPEIAEPVGTSVYRMWVQTVRQGWWVVLLIVAAAIATAAVLTARQTPLYQSSTTIAVLPSAAIADPNDVVRSLDTLERRTIISTLARVAGTSDLIERAATAAGLPPANARRTRVTATVLPNTNLLRINVEGEDRDGVATLANAAATTLADTTLRMYRVYQLTVISRAAAPNRPFFPDRGRNYAVALVAGLVAAAGALFVLHRMARRQPPDRARTTP